MPCQAVQEVTVVRHHQQGAFILAQILFKDVHGDNVQVVSRFIENQQIRLFHEDRQKVQTPLLASRKL